MYHRLLGSRLPQAESASSVCYGGFLPTPSSDKQKFPHLGCGRQGLGESEVLGGSPSVS